MAKKTSEPKTKTVKKASKKSTADSTKVDSTAASMPAINTDNAAAAAAAMVGNRAVLASGQTVARPESSAFKQLKQNLAKPAGSMAGDLLGNVGGQKKMNQPSAFGKQVGRNQTFGADVNRTGVPRRTGG